MGNTSDRRHWGRAARYCAWFAVALVAAVLAAAFILPEFLDTPAVRAEVQRRLSAAVNGEVTWDELSVGILPAPHGALRKLRVEIPESASINAERADVRLRIWPLLRGDVEISYVTLVAPAIRLDLKPAAPRERKSPDRASPPDFVEIYRSVMGPIVRSVQAFAPDTVIGIENAEVDVRAPGLPPIQLSQLSLQAHSGKQGLGLEATAASPYWRELKVLARVEYADLSAKASLEATDVEPQAWLDHFFVKSPAGVSIPRASLIAHAHADGKKSFSCEFAVGAGWVEVVRGAERARVDDVAVKGRVVAEAGEIAVHVRDTRLGPSRLPDGVLRYSLRNGSLAGNIGYDLDLAQAIELTRRALPEKNREALAVIQSASGRARGTTRLAFDRKGWNVHVEILKSDAWVLVRGLPGPVAIAGGSVHVAPGSVEVERAALSLLDTRARASTRISYGDRLRIQGSIAEGTVGGKFLAWAWQAGGVPPHLALRTPIGVTAEQFAWEPDGTLDVRATARFTAGPSIAVDFGRASGGLDIRRAAVKDERSDALIVARIAGPRFEGRFSGSLHGSSIMAMLRGGTAHSGGVSGDIRLTFDRDRPRDASAEGHLKGESLDLAPLTGQPLKIERIDLAADRDSLRIREAVVHWAEQRATVRGQVKRGADGPVIDAQLDSPGVNVDALFPPGEKTAAAKPSRPDAGEPSKLWPLPVTGRVVVRSDFVQSGRYKLAPIAATLVLEERRAHLDLKEAQLCGISLPLTLEATPGGFTASAKVSAQKQQLEQAAQCLTGEHVLITGDFDLVAAVTARGKAGELARNMKGSVVADLRDGKVMKFGLLGNILSMQNVAALLKQGGPKLDAQGFPYRRIRIVGGFDSGRFVVEEGAFHSDAIGLATSGWISLLEPESRLLVLVAPFSRVDELVRVVPIVGYVVGGTFTSVPVGVSGDIRDPLIVPLGPGAITSEVLGIFERTLKLPVKLIEPLREK